jgi:hypothetical protein
VGGEAPLRVPDGFRVVRMAPGADALDPTKEASKALLDKFILLRFENFGWCNKGTIIKRVTDRRGARQLRGQV